MPLAQKKQPVEQKTRKHILRSRSRIFFMEIAENHRKRQKLQVLNDPEFSNLSKQYFLRYWLKTKKIKKSQKFAPKKHNKKSNSFGNDADKFLYCSIYR